MSPNESRRLSDQVLLSVDLALALRDGQFPEDERLDLTREAYLLDPPPAAHRQRPHDGKRTFRAVHEAVRHSTDDWVAESQPRKDLRPALVTLMSARDRAATRRGV